jgi:hypothetical protein
VLASTLTRPCPAIAESILLRCAGVAMAADRTFPTTTLSAMVVNKTES